MYNYTYSLKDVKLSSAQDNYVNLVEGENKFRVLSNYITGWEDWSEDKKVFRFPIDKKPEMPLVEGKKIKQFLYCIVWSYEEEKIQILPLTQVSIIKALQKFEEDPKKGHASLYDINIVKSGENKETKYIVLAGHVKPISKDIVKAFHDKPCNLLAIFENKDPFDPSWKDHSPCVIDLKEEKKTESIDITLLKSMLSECHPHYQDEFLKTLALIGCPNLNAISADLYPRLKASVEIKRKEHLNFLANEEKFVAI